MIKSMTGYGVHREIIDGREITVEIKSVNNRYLDFQCSYPRSFGYLENKMKTYISKDIKRGRISVGISIYTVEDIDTKVVVDKELAQSYIYGLRDVMTDLDLEDDLKLTSLLEIKDVFSIKKELPNEEVIWSSVKKVADVSLEKFKSMTAEEGKELKKDILVKLNNIDKEVNIIKELAPKSVKLYQEGLYSKLLEVLESKDIEETRIITEAAIYADRVSTDEEIVRLNSHLLQIKGIFNSDEDVVGRKIDFLLQEINREINTIGSKAQDIIITNSVIFLKSELEKIREQIQNIV